MRVEKIGVKCSEKYLANNKLSNLTSSPFLSSTSALEGGEHELEK